MRGRGEERRLREVRVRKTLAWLDCGVSVIIKIRDPRASNSSKPDGILHVSRCSSHLQQVAEPLNYVLFELHYHRTLVALSAHPRVST
jgi:hypothetical protein